MSVMTFRPRRVIPGITFHARERGASQEIEEKPDERILGTNYRDVSRAAGFPAFAHLLSGLPPTWFPCSSPEFQPPHVANRTSAWRYPVVRIEFAIPRRDATFPAVFLSLPFRGADVTRTRNSRRRRVLQLDFAENRVGIIFPYQLGPRQPSPRYRPCRQAVVLSAKYRHVTRTRRARNGKLHRAIDRGEFVYSDAGGISNRDIFCRISHFLRYRRVCVGTTLLYSYMRQFI